MTSEAVRVLKVLQVEDSKEDHLWVTHLLEKAHTEGRLGKLSPKVRHATSLAEALEALRKEHFDVIFFDLFLPDAEGLEGLKEIVPKSGDAPVLVLSGTEDDQMAYETIRYGAQDFLPKSEISEKSLARRLKLAVERTARGLRLQERRMTTEVEREVFDRTSLNRIEELSRSLEERLSG